ncbi:AAA domain-containing protein [Dyella sp.]|uniref:AAA domain-containing protein n=1 Tax=Dyella sp. TaxID=1869338 RepID=UPI002B490B36|nr:AAA domain-containing protein [Dyella sp.]HKT28984.1 AAA domain-containing protein [Dyella sp.]
MVSIYVNGENRAGQFVNWEIFDHHGRLKLKLHFRSGKSYTTSLDACKVIPSRTVEGALCTEKGSAVFRTVEEATIYGERYVVVRYCDEQKPSVRSLDDIEFAPEASLKENSVFRYFVDVAKARVGEDTSQSRSIAGNVLKQLEKLLPHADTALYAYCTGTNQTRDVSGSFIYPFGVNESQLRAVERAFASQVSLIEGPPGTGKTQTILNIVANIVLRGKTIAILSNNNAAVENVYEKLGKAGLDYLVAKLGNSENRQEFFAATPVMPANAPATAPTMQQVQVVLQTLKQLLHAQNAVARLQAEIDELTIEQRYLLQWQRENGVVAPVALDNYRLSPRKTADLMAYLTYLAERRIRFKDRVELLLNFKILRAKPYADEGKRKGLIYALQLHFYEKALQEKNAALTAYRQELTRGNFEALLKELAICSMAYLKHHLQQHVPPQEAFDKDNYRKHEKFSAFVRRYPIIGSSTHSIVNSMAGGAILDYVIIDEASQQDIVPGILALGCARNLIIVGDRKQLPHIPAKLDIAPPAQFYDCDKYSLLESCLQVFKGSIPVTLLKEHYRCHPKIIQFCNQQFYDNQLIPMTRDAGEKALKLIVTAKGNHARNYSNLRELESLLETLNWDGESEWDSENSRGFIAPYKAQVTLSQTHLSAEFVKDTVHKFQGRECDEIIFSTVLDKKQSSQRSLGFVDDPHLVNVAVSRARNSFTLVTGDDVFAGNNGHIAALVRYIEYYADEEQIHHANVVSAFDLLYKEYDQSLERLNARLRASDSIYKSEQIVAQILRDTLSQEAYRAMKFHPQVRLNQVASSTNEALTPAERNFMEASSSCDFVLYFKVGKRPFGVIEVDGGFHDTMRQAQRDALKDSILKKSEISLLRLRTVESHIEEKIANFLAQWTSSTSSA